MSEPEQTDQEIYQEILKAVHEKDGKIATLEKEVKELKEAKEKIAKEQAEADNTIIGQCDDCHHSLTAAEARANEYCPYCHTGRTVSTVSTRS